MKAPKISNLIQVYLDMEETLKGLRAGAAKRLNADGSPSIDVRKLITQLSKSQRRLKRKIGNTLLLEKQELSKRWKDIASNLRSDRV